MFSVTISDGSVERTLLADESVDVNIIQSSVHKSLIEANAIKKTTLLDPHRPFEVIVKGSKISADRNIVADVHLRIRHMSALIITNATWYANIEYNE